MGTPWAPLSPCNCVLLKKWPDKTVYCVAHEKLPDRYDFIVPERALFESRRRRIRGWSICPSFWMGTPIDCELRRLTMKAHVKQPSTITKAVPMRPVTSLFHDPVAASTTEMVLRIADLWGAELSREIASSIYAGLIFDTSVFRYGHTDADTLRIAARLVEQGIDHRRIVEKVLFEQRIDKVRLRGRMISDMQVEANGQYAWACLSAAEVNGTETGGLVDDLVFVEGVEVGALLVENSDGRIKVSLRSRGGVDVADLAQRCAPSGGGHPRSAGVTLDSGLTDACVMVSQEVHAILKSRSAG